MNRTYLYLPSYYHFTTGELINPRDDYFWHMEENRKQFVLSMLGYAAQRDISVGQLCKLTGIDAKALKEGTHPAISQHQLNNLWVNASHLGNDPLFGLHFGESLQLAALGIVGEIIKSSATVGEALTQAASLIHLFTDSFRLEVTQSKKSFVVHLKITKETEKDSFSFLQMRDLMLVFLIHELDGLLLEKIKPERVKVSFDSKNASEYERVLRCKPVNKKDECSFEFKMSYWHEPIITANYELQKLLLQKVLSEKQAIKQGIKLRDRVEDYLKAHAYLGILSLDEVASNFNVSSRSLQRRLQEEGINFQQLADLVRKSLAEHYLKTGNYQIKEISNMLGYNELSAFSRAFKRWTGKPPVAYQA